MAKTNRPANTALAACLALSMATPISSAYAQDALTHDEQPPPIEAAASNASDSPDNVAPVDALSSPEESEASDKTASSETASAKDEVNGANGQTGT